MNPKQLCKVLNNFVIDGLANNVFLASQQHQIDVVGNRISLKPVVDIGMVSSGGISASEYVDLLDREAYSAVFADGSIICIQATFDGNTVESHRYFFIPCPFYANALVGRPQHISLADWLRDSIALEGVSSFRSVGTFRFDCVRSMPEDLADPHPVSHMTFGSADCRMPVKGPVSIAYFLHFVFDNFYRADKRFWLNYSSYLTSGETEVTITTTELMQQHLNWEE
ncbi:DUF2290 domain-containing protein [Rhizobium sp. RMa-01]|uniref:DUF2290 domain-containing protein n=1 Tax=unclassified Rhizobium TaxID=2613769 RepID=UPI0008D9823C|nr:MULTISPECIES: DUF2290 domain-containing protein [unclassified Rhizobium]OHV18595.1 hypothetical protein BBJ66_20350 [Rhizobium sp. RSm-3]RVU09334.1 DUF2290 domain-containing protein [Rhizobium sp. RMa-01]